MWLEDKSEDAIFTLKKSTVALPKQKRPSIVDYFFYFDGNDECKADLFIENISCDPIIVRLRDPSILVRRIQIVG